MANPIEQRLEQYTAKRPQEILIVTAEIGGESDQITIFKGYSSSLMHPTAFDPDVSVLPEGAKIISIERVLAPYNPESPNYLEQGLTWEAIQPLLSEVGV